MNNTRRNKSGYRFTVYSDKPKKNVRLFSVDLNYVKFDYLDFILKGKRCSWINEPSNMPWSLTSLATDHVYYREGTFIGRDENNWKQRINGNASVLYFLGEYGRRNAGDWKIKVERI